MKRSALQIVTLLVTCAVIPGCLMNSVHPITRAPGQKLDSRHATVVVGIGLDVVWPYAAFQLTWDEYSVKKQNITGNCFFYNRIDATIPPSPSKVTYLAYEVPANIYVYSWTNANATLTPASAGHAFIAPPGSTVYFGDYVFVGNKTVEFRRDIDAARVGIRAVLPRNVVLEPAEPTTTAHIQPFLCTP